MGEIHQLIIEEGIDQARLRAVSKVDRQAVDAVAAVLAEEAARYGGLLVHYSTDYVFDGSKSAPWLEEDLPQPLNVYGSTKLAGEQAIAAPRSTRRDRRRQGWCSSHRKPADR